MPAALVATPPPLGGGGGGSHGVNGLGYVPGAAFVRSAGGLSCSGQTCWSPDPPAQIQPVFLWRQRGMGVCDRGQRSAINTEAKVSCHICLQVNWVCL